MLIFSCLFLLYADLALGVLLETLAGSTFNITYDAETGAIWSLAHPKDPAHMNWISAPDNAPWLPLSSRWGLGYMDLGPGYFHRARWTDPQLVKQNCSTTATYHNGPIQLQVTRRIDPAQEAFLERYAFTNVGNTTIDINSYGGTAVAIYTPFNDHYTNSSDVYENRAHTHLWAGGGMSSWIKQTRMGGRGPHLGFVLTEGSLMGYSIESRDIITQSNTRGVFLLHPDISVIEPNQTIAFGWTMFWHESWDDFFAQCATRSKQFVRFNVSSLTSFPGETVNIIMSGAVSSSHTLMDGQAQLPLTKQGSVYTVSFTAHELGERTLRLMRNSTCGFQNTSIVINTVPEFENIIANRTHFIASKQQVDPAANATIGGAYVVYDNEINSIVTFDTASDRNAGRERVGMGVLMARWLYYHPDEFLKSSLEKYYEYVGSKLQNSSGYVFDGPVGTSDTQERLYNWPWVMQLHLRIAALNWTTTDLSGGHSNTTLGPLQRFVQTVEDFYSHNATNFYAIGIPVLEGLRALNSSSTRSAYNRVLSLFTAHAERIMETGIKYPPSEVNFEQSIVAPAAIMLLELYRATGNRTWLEAASPHFELLQLFGGQQPDHHLHEVAIRHWDGFWFGKHRLFGDTQPHYWSTLTAVAMHHMGIATNDQTYMARAEGILRANMALFTPDGRGSCAWLYPVTVDGRTGHYADPYANDQDWALVHTLEVLTDTGGY